MQFETSYQYPSYSQTRHLIRSALLFILYYLVSELGYLFVFFPEPAAHFWPAAGVTLAFLLRTDFKCWTPYLVAIFAGEFFISINHSIPFQVALLWAVADTIEPSLAAFLICKFLHQSLDISSPKHLGTFLMACIISPMIGASIAAYASVNYLNAPSYMDTFKTWWFAISLGEILVAPFILTWSNQMSLKYARQHLWEGLFLILLFIVITFLTFSTQVVNPSDYLHKHLLMYLMLPLFLWTLIRFEEFGVFTVLLVVNMIAAYFTARGKGPFAFFLTTPLVRLVSLQTYLSFVSLSTMALTTFIKQRRRSDDQLNSIIENSTAVIYLKDLNGRYLLVNQEWEKIFNTGRRHVLGRTDAELFPKELADHYRKNDLKVQELKTPLEFEEVTENAVYISIKFPLLDSNKILYAVGGISTDITLMKKASEDLQKAISIRDDFIAIASHELRTPLTPLKLQLSLLKKYLENLGPDFLPDTQLLKLMDQSDKDIEQMILLVENLLDVSKMSHGILILDRIESDMVPILNQVLERAETDLIKAKCQLEKLFPAHLMGNWDAFRIQQVLTNLLSNAMKYGSCKPIVVRLTKIDDHAVLSVKDHGIGISEENQNQIFGRFERVLPVTAYGGMGLGLFIVQEIVKAHKGSIKVISHEGLGSEFIIELPLK